MRIRRRLTTALLDEVTASMFRASKRLIVDQGGCLECLLLLDDRGRRRLVTRIAGGALAQAQGSIAEHVIQRQAVAAVYSAPIHATWLHPETVTVGYGEIPRNLPERLVAAIDWIRPLLYR